MQNIVIEMKVLVKCFQTLCRHRQKERTKQMILEFEFPHTRHSRCK